MDKYLLIKSHNNYADEFDVDGFAVWTESEWLGHQEAVAVFFDKKSKLQKPSRQIPTSYNDPNYWEITKEHRNYNRRQEAECGFGTNESVSFYSLEDYLGSFQVTEITEEERQVFLKFFGKSYRKNIEFGMFLSLEDQLEDQLENNPSDNEDQ